MPGPHSKEIVLTKDWRQWVWQIEKHKLTVDDVAARVERMPDAADYLQAFRRATTVTQSLKADGITPATPMQYSTQLIILFDYDLEETARLLQEKRETAGDVGKSYILYYMEGDVRLEPKPDALPVLDERSRVYVVCHGDPLSTVAFRAGRTTQQQWDPARLATELKQILPRFGATRVKRISLNMCFSAGNPQGRNTDGPEPVRRVGQTESYAYRLYQLLKDVADEVAGRAESVRLTTQSYAFNGEPERNIGMRRVTGPDRQHHGPGRKIVFSKETTAPQETARRFEFG